MRQNIFIKALKGNRMFNKFVFIWLIVLSVLCSFCCSLSSNVKIRNARVFSSTNRFGEKTDIKILNDNYTIQCSCWYCKCYAEGKIETVLDTLIFKKPTIKYANIDAYANIEKLGIDSVKMALYDETDVLLTGLVLAMIKRKDSTAFSLNEKAEVHFVYTPLDSILLDLGIYVSEKASLDDALARGKIYLHSEMPCANGCFMNLECSKFLLNKATLTCLSSGRIFTAI
jgi:hypothetical protein